MCILGREAKFSFLIFKLIISKLTRQMVRYWGQGEYSTLFYIAKLHPKVQTPASTKSGSDCRLDHGSDHRFCRHHPNPCTLLSIIFAVHCKWQFSQPVVYFNSWKPFPFFYLQPEKDTRCVLRKDSGTPTVQSQRCVIPNYFCTSFIWIVSITNIPTCTCFITCLFLLN